MSTSPLTHRAALLSVTATVLIVLSQLLRLGAGLLIGSGSASSAVIHTLTYGLALLSMFVLLLAATAIYVRDSAALGRLDFIGYLAASLSRLPAVRQIPRRCPVCVGSRAPDRAPMREEQLSGLGTLSHVRGLHRPWRVEVCQGWRTAARRNPRNHRRLGSVRVRGTSF